MAGNDRSKFIHTSHVSWGWRSQSASVAGNHLSISSLEVLISWFYYSRSCYTMYVPRLSLLLFMYHYAESFHKCQWYYSWLRIMLSVWFVMMIYIWFLYSINLWQSCLFAEQKQKFVIFSDGLRLEGLQAQGPWPVSGWGRSRSSLLISSCPVGYCCQRRPH